MQVLNYPLCTDSKKLYIPMEIAVITSDKQHRAEHRSKEDL